MYLTASGKEEPAPQGNAVSEAVVEELVKAVEDIEQGNSNKCAVQKYYLGTAIFGNDRWPDVSSFENRFVISNIYWKEWMISHNLQDTHSNFWYARYLNIYEALKV